jgi:predicted ATPase with chaperone activity
MINNEKKGSTEYKIFGISSKDIRESRERVNRAVEMHKKSPLFTQDDFNKALKKIYYRAK